VGGLYWTVSSVEQHVSIPDQSYLFIIVCHMTVCVNSCCCWWCSYCY